MHGTVIDWVAVNTIEDAYKYQTAETWDKQTIGETGFIKKKALDFQPKFERILDIGSLDIIGNMPDYNFMDTHKKWIDIVSAGRQCYTGIDIMGGKNVDRIMNAHELQFPDNSFDLVLCLQMLEHDDNCAATIREAYRVLEPGKAFIMTCATDEHPEHADLGGGSRHYEFITPKMLAKWYKDAGFKKPELNVIGSNFYTYAIK